MWKRWYPKCPMHWRKGTEISVHRFPCWVIRIRQCGNILDINTLLRACLLHDIILSMYLIEYRINVLKVMLIAENKLFAFMISNHHVFKNPGGIMVDMSMMVICIAPINQEVLSLHEKQYMLSHPGLGWLYVSSSLPPRPSHPPPEKLLSHVKTVWAIS